MNNMLAIIKSTNWKAHILILLALGVSGVYLGVAIWLKSSYKASLSVLEASLTQQGDTNSESHDSLSLYNSIFGSFIELKNDGRVGKPNRLQWVETVHYLAEGIGLDLIDYTIGGTSTYHDDVVLEFDEPLETYNTTMNISLALKNELQFVAFYESLRLASKGLFIVDECDLRRNPIENGVDPNHVGFVSNCSLSWRSVQDVTLDLTVASNG